MSLLKRILGAALKETARQVVRRKLTPEMVEALRAAVAALVITGQPHFAAEIEKILATEVE